MLKKDLIHNIMKSVDRYLLEIMTEFVALRPKTYSYLTDDCKEDNKAKGTKKCVIK